MSTPVKRVAIFGSTGSIGRNALEVIRPLKDRFKVSWLTAQSNIDLLLEQAIAFRPTGVVVLDPKKAVELRQRIPSGIEVLDGSEGLLEVARREDVDLVLSSLVGFAGVRPTAEAIRHGKDIALANKETLVAAGSYIMGLVRKHGVQLLPVDSEHSAIFQCLTGERSAEVSRLYLTASGGPFRTLPSSAFDRITVEDALRHPNWTMGKKITIDSATLMNKGLEVIEAHWLFGLSADRIEVVVHPQSIIHSMVEFVDGSVKAQLGMPDMKLPIQYALTYPDRLPLNGGRVNFPNLREMTFAKPDVERFPALRLAYAALETGGTAPAVLNAANEVAVNAFLERALAFQNISRVIEETLHRSSLSNASDIDTVIHADAGARDIARSVIDRL